MELWKSVKRLGACAMFGAALHCASAGAAESVTIGAPAGNALPAASPISAELMRSIRAATFEVVMKKPEHDPLTYDKPLPLDLLPFAERNDKYRSIGTAFAIGPDSFVTAAHVVTAVSGSQHGIPALRDSQGNVHPFDRVTKFSLDKDFIVFTVTGAPRVTPLPTSIQFQIDTQVLAVGNALGQGIVARDGILTSETPEEQDGAWKWLRFSAPASPGNSGGPLLDARGRVIGVIARKSANENLNYALPIALLLDAPANKGSIDMRMTVSLPFLQARKTNRVRNSSIDLPLRFGEFDQKLLAMTDQLWEVSRNQLLQEVAADIFPRGKSSRLLGDTYYSSNPSLIAQQADGTWDVPRNNNPGTVAQVGNDGSVWMSAQTGAALFRVRFSSEVDIGKARGDSKLLSEQLMKGIVMGRIFGTERVRITSLGDAGKPQAFKDDFGRAWQQWRYPMAFSDSTMIVSATPTPEGYVGFMRTVHGSLIQRTLSEMRLLANFVQISYEGSLPQWRAFLADAQLRPEGFGRWQTALDPAGQVRIETPRFSVWVDRQVLNLTEQSQLSVFTGTVMDGDRPEWDVLGMGFRLELRNSPGIGVLRRARPAADVGQNGSSRWQDMVQLRGQFAGNPLRNANGGIGRRVVGPEGVQFAEAPFLYELNYNTTTQVQGEIQRALPLLQGMVRIKEK